MRTTGTRVLPLGARDAQRRIVETIETERRLPDVHTGHGGIAPRSASL
jgi:hypothetical protein